MINIIRERMRQGHRTSKYPKVEPVLSARFRGRPIIKPELCQPGCTKCIDSCAFGAIAKVDGVLQLDMGRCLFCPDCQAKCEHGALIFSSDYRLASNTREGLQIGPDEYQMTTALNKKMQQLFGRSLKLRQVSAGGCNACEADLNVLSTLTYDLARFGIQFVASPRHADGILITGPVTENMKSAVLDTYAAIPAPKIVIASGACAIGGGPFRDNPEVNNGVGDLLPVDLYIPGCPPHPYTALDGMLRLLGQIKG